MTDIVRSREALVERILQGDGTASREQRRAAFDGAAERDAGLSEDQIFELDICAAVGEATRLHAAALAALAALEEE